MKTCEGCNHLFPYGGKGFCDEPVLPKVPVEDSISGVVEYNERLKYGLPWRGTSCETMRQEGMPCGPERKLYADKWIVRLMRAITSRLSTPPGPGRD